MFLVFGAHGKEHKKEVIIVYLADLFLSNLIHKLVITTSKFSQGTISNVGRTYSVINCTKSSVFVSTLPTLSDVSILVTSVLANFICDACVTDDLTGAAHREITRHVELLHQFSLANPEARITISPPLPRFDPEWFQAYLPGFSAFLYHEIGRMSNPRIKFMSPFIAPPSYFESDGVHLNADAGTSFIHYLVNSADLLFPVDCAGSDPTVDAVPEATGLAQLTLTVSALREDVDRRRLQDNLVFSRIKEDRDFEINKSREDRCTLSGLRIISAPPQDPKERKEFFKKFVGDLVAEACPLAEVKPVVVDVLVNMRPGRGPPYFEVKFDSVASSTMFRIASAKLAKDEVGSFKGVFVSNTVNQSTRIRIDILKLLAKRLSTPTELCYVQGFSSRPTLHYKVKETKAMVSRPAAIGTGRSYTFTESVERWGHLLTPSSLEGIRRKASQSFKGCLEQYFVVLGDRPAPDTDDFFTRLLPSQTSQFARRGQRGLHQSRRGPRGGLAQRHHPRFETFADVVREAAPVIPPASSLPVSGAKRSADQSDDLETTDSPLKKK